MPMHLAGSCKCGAVHFALDSHTPVPYQRCYCAICRKTAGGGGFAINIGGISDSLTVTGADSVGMYHAEMLSHGHKVLSRAERRHCRQCGSALWVYDPKYPELVHPFASAINTALPVPPATVHIMLGSKAPWVQPDIRPEDETYDEYPRLSLADWHKQHGQWRE